MSISDEIPRKRAREYAARALREETHMTWPFIDERNLGCQPISSVVEIPTTAIAGTRMIANLDDLNRYNEECGGNLDPELMAEARRLLRDANVPVRFVRVCSSK